MGKGFLKKRRLSRARRQKGPCAVDGCAKNGDVIHTCTTCERVGRPDPFQRQVCQAHYFVGLGEVKRHALVAHPVNILRVVAAGLKGEDIS